MRQTHIQNIRRKCIEANPEIVELKFGCKVFIPGENNFSNRGKRGFGIITKSYVGETASWSGYDRTEDKISVYMYEHDVYRPVIGINKNKIEITGRDIRLADVLYVMNKCKKSYEIHWLVDELGMFQRYARNATMKTYQWNLLKDNLEDQSDEMLAFINNLLQ